MRVFEFTDYRAYIEARLKEMPRRGYGQRLKIAKALRVHTSLITQILKGSADLSIGQCLKLAEYFGLNRSETEYFVDLVLFARAADQDTKIFYRQQIQTKSEKAMNLKERLHAKQGLGEKDQPLFYSYWYYSAIRLMTSIKGYQSAVEIAERLRLPVGRTAEVLEFLVRTGLCTERNGEFHLGELKTYLSRESTLAVRHQVNWRLKVLEQLASVTAQELAFTSVVTISKKDFARIREQIAQLIQEFQKTVDSSGADELCCLNIDWVVVK